MSGNEDLSAFTGDSDASDSPLDQSEELNAVVTAQLTALKEETIKAEMQRRGTLQGQDPIGKITAPARMIDFINNTRRLTVEKLEERIVNESIPIMLWKMREYAVEGKYTETRAIEIWLNWASKVMSRPKREKKDPSVKSGALFDARLTKGDVIQAEAKPVEPEKKIVGAKRPRSGNFSTAGEFIGKVK